MLRRGERQRQPPQEGQCHRLRCNHQHQSQRPGLLGTISFNPINVNGSSVGFGIDLQATSSTYQYIPDYGIASPPPSFPPGASDTVVLTPKTFIVCSNYNDDSSGATACQ
jgi:hypothetical protein